MRYIILISIAISLLIFLPNKQTISPHNLISIDGEKFQIPSQNKKLTWINFWSASCPTCLKELPDLQQTHQKHQKSNDVQLITIAMHYDPPNIIKETQTRLALTLPIGLDLRGKIAEDFDKNMVIPSHYLVDKKGNILYSHKGIISNTQLEQQLQSHL